MLGGAGETKARRKYTATISDLSKKDYTGSYKKLSGLIIELPSNQGLALTDCTYLISQ